LNAAIRVLLDDLNTRPFKKLEGCRRSRFLETERAALAPLPASRYEFGEWRRAKVHPDYHIEVKRAYYSVPYRLIGQTVEVRLTAHALEIFHSGKLVAAHSRTSQRARHSTRDAHRPPQHTAVIEQSLTRVIDRATTIGTATAEVLRRQAARRKHPEETLRSAQGILRLAKDFTPALLERACQRAMDIQSYSYRTVRTLIETPAPTETTATAPDLNHDNVRGPDYFQ
jgi:transposase